MMNFRDAAQALSALEAFFREIRNKLMYSNFPTHPNHKKFMEDLREFITSKAENISIIETNYLLSLLDLKDAYEETSRLYQELWNEKHPEE